MDRTGPAPSLQVPCSGADQQAVTTTGDTSNALALVDRLIEMGVDGKAPGMKTAVALAEQYSDDSHYTTHDARIKALVRWESSKSFTTGFATGLGGFATLPVALPTGMIAAWALQARMVAAVAHLRGYDVQDERVRTLAIACIVGDATVREAARALGTDLATRMGKAAIARVPGRVLIDINKRVGFRLLTKAGSTGVINLTRMVPFAGGLAGGTVDGMTTRAVGATARRAFPDRPHDGLGIYAPVEFQALTPYLDAVVVPSRHA